MNIHDIPKPTPSSANINLTVLNENALNALRGEVHISYSSILNGKKFKFVQLYIDDQNVSSSNDSTGYITFYTTGYSDGTHRLRLELTTSTNSGSLADNLGSEAYVLTKEYQTYIINAPINASSITNYVIRNGVLTIQWNKFAQQGFQKYILRHDDYRGTIVGEVDDVNQTECSDPSFIGGVQIYRLQTIVAGYTFENAENYYFDTFHSNLSYTIIDNSKIQLTWQKTPYYGAFVNYHILRHHYCGYVHEDLLAEKTGINDTSFVITNPIFGGAVEHYIQVIPRIGNPTTIADTTIPEIGNLVGYYPSIAEMEPHVEYIPSANQYYSFWSPKVQVIDGTSIQLLKNVQLPITTSLCVLTSSDMSADGKLIYCISNASTSEIKKIDPISLGVQNTFTLKDMLPGVQGTLMSISISDNNILATIHDGTGTSGSGWLSLFQLDSSKFLSNINNVGTYTYNLQVSRNGNFIINGSSLYKFSNNALTLVGAISTYATFNQAGDKLVQCVDKKIQVLQCNDLSIIKEIVFTDYLNPYHMEMDRITGYIGFDADSGYYYVVDIESGQVMKKIPIVMSNQIFNYHYQNGTIFGDHRYMKIP